MKYDITISKEEILNPLLDDSGYEIAAGPLALASSERKGEKPTSSEKVNPEVDDI